MNPLVTLFHISDLHVVRPRHLVEEWEDCCTRVDAGSLDPIAKLFAEGVAPHDEWALLDLLQFLEEERETATASGGKTWVACTGDLTTWGDDPSMSHARDHLQAIRDLGCRVIAVHGNHDAWPGRFPKSRAETIAQRHKLRSLPEFAPVMPDGPVCLGSAPIDVQIYRLNTVVHDWRNLLALGEVREDQYWKQGKGVATAGVQLSNLHSTSAAAIGVSGRALRIVLTHHPVQAPYNETLDISAGVQMKLVNRDEVANHLGIGSPTSRYHLVVSGHTHDPSPPLGKVGISTISSQLVVGTASQTDRRRPHDPFPQQLQALRIFDTSKGGNFSARVERHCAVRQGARRGGTTPGFTWLPAPNVDAWHFEL